MTDPVTLMPYDTLTITVEEPATVYVETKPKVRWFSVRKREKIRQLRKENAELRHRVWVAENDWSEEEGW